MRHYLYFSFFQYYLSLLLEFVSFHHTDLFNLVVLKNFFYFVFTNLTHSNINLPFFKLYNFSLIYFIISHSKILPSKSFNFFLLYYELVFPQRLLRCVNHRYLKYSHVIHLVCLVCYIYYTIWICIGGFTLDFFLWHQNIFVHVNTTLCLHWSCDILSSLVLSWPCTCNSSFLAGILLPFCALSPGCYMSLHYLLLTVFP